MTLDRFGARRLAAAGLDLRRLVRDRRGAVAMLLGLAAIPLLMLVGLAVDFAFISQARAQLDLAADTAALTAAKTAGAAFVANNSANAVTLGQQAGFDWFCAQVGTIPDATFANLKTGTNCPVSPSVTVTVTQAGNAYTASVTYTANVKTVFQALFHITSTAVSNTAAAKIVANAYVNVTFLLDNSSSMLIAATTTDIANLQPLTAAASCPQATGGYNNSTKKGTVNSGCVTAGSPVTCTTGSKVVTLDSSANTLGGCLCAFACHWDASNNDFYGIAQTAGITLRLNVLQSALATAVQLIQSSEVIDSQFGAAIYQFNSSLSQVWPPTGDSSAQATSDMACLQSPAPSGNSCSRGYALTAAQAITTPVLPDEADTNFPAAMTALAAASTAAGDGSSTATPKKALIIITDGIQDYCNPLVAGCSRTLVPGYSLNASNGTSGSYEGPLSARDCDRMKALGYSIFVLYTTYYVPPPSTLNPLVPFSNSALSAYVNGTEPSADAAYDLTTNLKGCTTDPVNNYVQAAIPSDIQAALTTMVKAALNSGARLTQ